jgi:hypothetical protein
MELSSRKTSFATCNFGWFSRQSALSFMVEGFSCSLGGMYFFKSVTKCYMSFAKSYCAYVQVEFCDQLF